MSWKNSPSPPCSAMTPPIWPTCTALDTRTIAGQIPVIPNATHCAAIHALLVHTCAAKLAPLYVT